MHLSSKNAASMSESSESELFTGVRSQKDNLSPVLCCKNKLAVIVNPAVNSIYYCYLNNYHFRQIMFFIHLSVVYPLYSSCNQTRHFSYSRINMIVFAC